jgi:hypothetical protein
MRIDEIIEKLMVVFACLPIYWFFKLGYWAWSDPDMLEKNLKYFRQYPSSASNIYFDKKSDIRMFKITFVILLGILLPIGILFIIGKT